MAAVLYPTTSLLVPHTVRQAVLYPTLSLYPDQRIRQAVLYPTQKLISRPAGGGSVPTVGQIWPRGN